MYIDFEVKDNFLYEIPFENKSQPSILNWNIFEFISGKKIDFSKRYDKKIRVTKSRGNVYVSDHSWILNQYYKKNNIIVCCSFINNYGEALLNNTNALKIYSDTNPLDWTII